MESKGFGAEYTKRYKMVNQFHQERRPLIIVVCGAPCTGKSSLAQQLASRFNMPNVLQTDMFYELLRTSEDKPLNGRPLWERSDLDAAQLVNEFQKECHVLRRSIDGDLVKTIRDGKSIIIEGLHLDPGLYLHEFGKYGISHLHTRSDSMLPAQADTAQQGEAVLVEPVNPEPLNPDRDVQRGAQLQPDAGQSEQSGVDTAKPAVSNSSKSEPSRDAQKLAQWPGGRMIFALQSMAKRMSPVLSSYVMPQQHQPVSQQEGLHGSSDTQGDQRGQTPLAHSPGSEWIAQQLQKAYKGLTSSLPAGIPTSNQAPATDPSIPDQESSAREDTEADVRQAEPPGAVAAAPTDQAEQQSLDQTHQAPEQSQSVGASQQPDASQQAPSSSRCQAAASSGHGAQTTGAGGQQAGEHGSSNRLAHPDEQASHHKSAADSDQHQQGGPDAGQPSPQDAGQPSPQGAGQPSPQPPAAGNEGSHAAVKAHKPHGVPDRIPAALALQSSKDSAAAVDASHSSETDQSAGVGEAAAGEEEARELKQPQVVQKQKQQEGKASPTPVFVPIVVAMDAQDHKVMVEEWYSRHMAVSGQLSNNNVSDKDMTDSANATYDRIRLLQDHLCTYEERNVPVVALNFANFSDMLDQLHDYLLQCIESAMQQ
ncbi:hypothetical protein ABBQ38_000183 [Trebouxia sp. C0009 RCD-2024]